MTIITVNAPKGRLGLEQRRELAETLTDAVLVPEVGQPAPAARVGFQVHFVERERDMMAIGGRLLSDADQGLDVLDVLDVMVIDVAVMDAAWQPDVRGQVIERVLAALAAACGLEKPSPTWWVNFRVIDEGSWGSSGGVLSVLPLLDSGVFTQERVKAVRAALGA
ncbi:tautomerase enzyme [Streptomyces sp. NBC_00704]|uniref:tautomerase family protein n=1 Tax=Streptomyces sp. NBC_00704 TaxID=2975809 RepID=UPI002E307103|nr:tautomerase enzyme [Streptomyces sp. NBC_00704]